MGWHFVRSQHEHLTCSCHFVPYTRSITGAVDALRHIFYCARFAFNNHIAATLVSMIRAALGSVLTSCCNALPFICVFVQRAQQGPAGEQAPRLCMFASNGCITAGL